MGVRERESYRTMSHTKQTRGVTPASRQHGFSRNEQRYRDLLEGFSDGVTILTPDGLVLDINQRPLADAHLRREEVVGKPFTDLPAWSHDPSVPQQFRAAIARATRGQTLRFEARIHPPTQASPDIFITLPPPPPP